jgi:phytoene synthase
MAGPSLSYCADVVKTCDYDRYLCTLFAPAEVREAWFTLFAFNHEIASVAEMVSEEMIGFMRFAWWREALDEIYAGGPVRKHPVAQALAETVRRYSLPRPPFDRVIDAREANLNRDITEVPEQWEAYFHATSSTLLALCAGVTGSAATPALEGMGVAWGCIGTARMLRLSGQDNAALLRLAEAKLPAPADMPAGFEAFRDAARFYLKRLETRKSTGSEARFGLLVGLCGRRLFRRRM